MKNRIKFSGVIFPILIVLTSLVLSYLNYSSGTFLSGWDNLHPEFNFKLNILRSFFAAWQEYQGLGVPGGMAHASEITRQLILWLFSYLIPTSFLRYFWAFLMLLTGPLGIYYLVDKIFFKDGEHVWSRLASFFAGCFYIFNLATLQYFFLPYETFLSFYGFLPWLLYFGINYLKKGGKNNLVYYLIISILATSAFYVQTMFLVYLMVLSVFILESLIVMGKNGLKRSVFLILATFIINSFWIGPVLYSTFSNSKTLMQSKINSIATPETQMQNIARGNFSDISLIKGFWWDYYDLLDSDKYEYLYINWIKYLEKPIFEKLGTAIFVASILGYLLSFFIKKKFSWKMFGIPLLLMVYFMLATINPPFGKLFSLIFTRYTILAEIFRSVFTKWSLVMALVYSIGIAFLIKSLYEIFKRKKLLLITPLFTFLFFLSASVLITKPFFQGNLISKRMKVNIPDEYFKAFEYLKDKDPNARIAYFPVHVFWGWNYYNWGYDGSGFPWYGFPQAFLDRVFDVWSSYNQSFYYEVYKAIYDNDPKTFENVLKKYGVNYLLIDSSIINPGGGGKELLYVDRVNSFTSLSESMKKIADFGFLSLFETDRGDSKFIKIPKTFNEVRSNLSYSKTDLIYNQDKDYYYSDEGIEYPFANLDDASGVTIKIENNSVNFVSPFITDFAKKKLLLPNFSGNEKDFEKVYSKDWIKVDNEKLSLNIPIINWTEENFSSIAGYPEAKNCDIKNKGSVFKEYLDQNYLLLKAFEGGISCDYVYFPSIKYTKGYLFNILGKNITGRGLKVFLFNVESGKLELEELLPFNRPFDLRDRQTIFDKKFVIYPKNIKDGKGFTLTFENRSIGKVSAENLIDKVEFIEIPIEWLTSIKLIPDNYSNQTNALLVKDVNKIGTTNYFLQVENEGLLELEQGYDEGWVAYSIRDQSFTNIKKWIPWFFGNKLKHVKVDSWANGWIVPEGRTGKISIVFWPQYLEWGGMILGTICLLIIVIYKPKKKLVDR